MFLSTLLVDVGTNSDRPRPGRTWLGNIYRVHQRLCMAFPDRKEPETENDAAPSSMAVHTERTNQSGFLFRIDHGINERDDRSDLHARRPVILVQSYLEPKWNDAFKLFEEGDSVKTDHETGKPVGNAGHLLAAPPQVKKIDWLELKIDCEYRFRVTVNPTRRVNNGPFKGKRVGVGQSPAAILDWLARKGADGGFELIYEKDEDGVDKRWRISNGVVRGVARNDRKFFFASAAIDGVLKIMDLATMNETLAAGIGSGKAFGFGLLSVARV